MGSALLYGVASKNIISLDNIFIVEPNKSLRKHIKTKGYKVFNNLNDIDLKKLSIDTILIAVKPQIIEDVLLELKDKMSNNMLLISIVAGKKVGYLKNILGGKKLIIRAMPNTPAKIGNGITALYCSPIIIGKYRKIVNLLFSSTGEVLWLKKESDMDIVTAISGSGPAYVFKFIEALIESSINAGLDLQTSRTLVKHTLFGASKLALESDISPKKLRIEVTSPGGTTEAAIKILEKRDQFNKIINLAINAAIKKSINLSS